MSHLSARARVLLVLLSVLALTSVALPASAGDDPSAPAIPAQPGPAPYGRPALVLAAGDSITQSRDGDYSWRYLLWKKLADDGTPATFVGSRTDTFGGGLNYRVRAFDQGHYALAGRTFEQGRVGLAAELAGLPRKPDVIVVGYGTNDLGVHGRTVDQTVADLKSWLTTARASGPRARFVLVEVMHVHDERAYNARLAALAADPSWSTEASPLAVAKVSRGWDVQRDTWDRDHHPTPSGDARLANGIAEALGALGVGDGRPSVPTDLSWQPDPTFSATYSAPRRRVQVTYDPGSVDATGTMVEWRRAGGAWSRSALFASSWTSPVLEPGGSYEFRLVPRRGFMTAVPGRSVVVRATNAQVAGPVTYDGSGRARVTVSCAAACSGHLQVWSDARGSRKSSATSFRLKAGQTRAVTIKRVPRVQTHQGRVRIAYAARGGAKIELNAATIGPKAASSVAIASMVRRDAGGRGTVQVSCRTACEGWVQAWSDAAGTVRSSVGHYRLKAGRSTSLMLSGLPPVGAAGSRVRLVQKHGGSVGSPSFRSLQVAAAPLPLPPAPNVLTSRVTTVDAQGRAALTVVCRQACSGWVQVWVDAQGSAVSEPRRYDLPNRGQATIVLGGVPRVATEQAFVRVVQTRPVIGENPQFRPLVLLPG